MVIRKLLLSLIVPLGFFCVGFCTIDDYGETTDEKFDQHIGEFYYYRWSEVGYPGLIERFRELQRNYGPLFNVVAVASNDFLHKRNGFVGAVASYHVPVLVGSAILIWLVFWFGACLAGTFIGLLAQLNLALMPRFVGDSQNNLKDMPLALFFTGTLLLFYLAYRKSRIWLYVLAGLALGLTYCIKINAVLIVPIFLAWVLFFERPGISAIVHTSKGLAVSGLAALATIPVVWPYYRFDYFMRFVETFKVFSRHEWNEIVLYLGRFTHGQDIAWHYPFVMLAVTMPLILLVAFIIGLIGPLQISAARPSRASAVGLLLVWILLPTCAQAFSSAPMYDGIRHYLVVLPAVAVVAAFGIQRILKWAWSRPPIGFAALAVIYCYLLFWNYNLHPYQVVFFNSLVGGERGGSKLFDFDYWGASYKEAAEWLESHAEPGSLVWLPYGVQHFHLDGQRFPLVSSMKDLPDYKVILQRGLLVTYDSTENYLQPNREPIHSIRAGGADLLRIFRYAEYKQLPRGSSISPLRNVQSALEPGLKLRDVREVSAADRQPEQHVDGMGFDCADNPYKDRETRIEYSGLVRIDKDGSYCFELYSDDFAALRLNEQYVVKNPSMRRTSNLVRLAPGWYDLKLLYSNNVGPGCLEVKWAADECSNLEAIPSEHLYQTASP